MHNSELKIAAKSVDKARAKRHNHCSIIFAWLRVSHESCFLVVHRSNRSDLIQGPLYRSGLMQNSVRVDFIIVGFSHFASEAEITGRRFSDLFFGLIATHSIESRKRFNFLFSRSTFRAVFAPRSRNKNKNKNRSTVIACTRLFLAANLLRCATAGEE